jgi:excisionase family DNA binding protein
VKTEATTDPTTDRPPGKPWRYAEAAEFLGVSKSTLERAVANGIVRTVTLGRPAIPDSELRRIAEQGLVPAKSAAPVESPSAA